MAAEQVTDSGLRLLLVEVPDFTQADPEAGPKLVCSVGVGADGDDAPSFVMVPPDSEAFDILWRVTGEGENGAAGPCNPGFKFYGVGKWGGPVVATGVLLGQRAARYPGRIPSYAVLAVDPATAADVLNCIARFGWRLAAHPPGLDHLPAAVLKADAAQSVEDLYPFDPHTILNGCGLS